MGTTANKLQKVLDSKNALKQSLISKGKTVPEKFSDYASVIDNMNVEDYYNIHFGTEAPANTDCIWAKATSSSQTVSHKYVVSSVNEWFYKDTSYVNYTSKDLKHGSIASIGSNIYVFGGESYTGSSYSYPDSTDIYKIDTETSKVTKLSATLPTSNGFRTTSNNAIVVGTNIYIFGGDKASVYSSAIAVFDSLTDTISISQASLPAETCSIAAAAVGNNIYMFGGKTYSGKLDTIMLFNTIDNTITVLDVKLPAPMSSISAVSNGSDVYLFGGSLESGFADTIMLFNTIDNTITTLDTKLPSTEFSIGTAKINNEIILLGDEDCQCVFNISNNTITRFKIDYIKPRSDCTTIGSKIYFLQNDYGKYVRVFDYDTRTPFVNKNDLLLLQSDEFPLFSLIKDTNNDVRVRSGNIYYSPYSGSVISVDVLLHDGIEWKKIN